MVGLGKQGGLGAHRIRHHEDRPVVESVGAGERSPDLPAAAADHRPCHSALVRLRRVDGVGALRAGYAAGLAILGASAEVPSGELEDPFFSSSRRRAGVT